MTSSTALPRADARRLSPESVALLRALLLCELASQTAQTAEARLTAREFTDHTEVEDVLAREGAVAAAVRADKDIIDIQDALRRLDRDLYGSCEECGASIPFERLEVIPHARRCVACSGTPRGLVS